MQTNTHVKYRNSNISVKCVMLSAEKLFDTEQTAESCLLQTVCLP